MKIAELKKYVDEAYKKGSDCNVEVWVALDNGESIIAEIDRIGQFNVIPDMTLTIKPCGEKLLTSRKMTEEELDYKWKYENSVDASMINFWVEMLLGSENNE